MGKNRLFRRTAALCVLILTAFLLLIQGTFAASAEKFNMSYIYFGNSNSYVKAVDNTKGSLNDISPSYFDLNTDGTLKLTPAVDPYFVSEMHKRGIKVTPFLSNHWDRQTGIAALSNRELLSQQIVDAIVNYNLDGVNVDIENVTETERDSYTDLVKLLRQKLPAGSSLSVAVACNPYNETTGWAASYDYAALAQNSDYLMIMAYDEHYQGGPEGPVASSNLVEKSIQYALDKVTADKIVLGIPLYGRYWKQGASYGGYGINAYTVDDMIARYHGVVTFDSESQSPKAVITINAQDEKPVVLGQKLDAGTYDIWYENEQSIKYKLGLVQKYNLKGTGSWSLGQESASTWDYYKLWLNGHYFTDIQGSWAQQSILAVQNKGWMVGTSSTEFMPNASLTRAEAAVILVRALGFEGEAGSLPGGVSFRDTASHWAVKEIEIARQHGIIEGMGDGTFAPDQPVTREEMAVMLERILTQLQAVDNPENGFSDVTPAGSPWAYDAILKMEHYNIIQGDSNGLFRPRDHITRAEMATLMDRIAGYIEAGPVLA